jgi:hypothetical protein
VLRSRVRWGHLEAEITSYDAVNMKIKIMDIFTHNFKEFFQRFCCFETTVQWAGDTADSTKLKRQTLSELEHKR